MQYHKNIHFRSIRMDWPTPEALYQKLNEEFNFDHDPCPPNPTKDGLTGEWGQRNFVNPPYGRSLKYWIAKGVEQRRLGKLVVFLIPSRTDNNWWHTYCSQASEIRFIKGRIKFGGAKTGAPFPSAVVIFRPEDLDPRPKCTRYANEIAGMLDNLLLASPLYLERRDYIREEISAVLERIASDAAAQ